MLGPIVEAIKDTRDPAALQILGEALKAVAPKLSDSQAQNAAKPVLAAIKDVTDSAAIKDTRNPAALQALGEALGALSAKLNAASAEAADVAVEKVLDKARDQATVAIYAKLSAVLTRHQPREQQITRIFHILHHPLTAGESNEYRLRLHERLPKEREVRRLDETLHYPLTAGEFTEHLLGLLEEVPGVQVRFGGDLWKAVEWAEAEQRAGRLNSLALDAPMRLP